MSSIQPAAYAPAVPRPKPAERQVNFRLPVATTERLEAAAAVLGFSQARIIADAVTVYLDGLPVDKRRVIDSVVAIRKKG